MEGAAWAMTGRRGPGKALSWGEKGAATWWCTKALGVRATMDEAWWRIDAPVEGGLQLTWRSDEEHPRRRHVKGILGVEMGAHTGGFGTVADGDGGGAAGCLLGKGLVWLENGGGQDAVKWSVQSAAPGSWREQELSAVGRRNGARQL